MARTEFARWGWLLLALPLASGCEIRTGGSPPPQHPQPAPAGAQPAPAGAQPAPAAAQPGPQSERTALHASVAAEVATARGLVKAVGIAIADASLKLSPRARRAHETASPKARAARQQLNSGQHLAARREAQKADQLLRPAVTELADKPRLPEPVRQSLSAQALESRDSVNRAVVAVRNTGQTGGLSEMEQAGVLFGEAAAAAQRGDSRGALGGLTRGLTTLGRGVVARFPAMR